MKDAPTTPPTTTTGTRPSISRSQTQNPKNHRPTTTNQPAQYDDVDADDYYTRNGRRDPRFDAPPDDFPAASVALAAGLLLFGACSLVLAWLHWTQALFGKKQAEVGFTVVGLLTIIPGAV